MCKRKTKLFLACCLIIIAFPNYSAFADDDYPPYSSQYYNDQIVKVATRLDISDGVIKGESADYSFVMPKDKNAKDFFIVDRVTLRDPNMALEKLDFYCDSYSQKYKPALIMSIYVFGKSQWNDAYALEKITRSRDYVFAVLIEQTIPFTQSQDRAFYIYCKNIITDMDYLKKSIVLPESQKNEFENTVFVNASPLAEKVEIIDGVSYVPLRRVCEAMNYKVTWNGSKKMVEVSKGTFKNSFVLKNGVYEGRGYKIVTIKDRTYASTSYLLRVLGKNIEIDEYGNVYMFGS